MLPPESFLTMRLPFIYGAETREGSTVPLKHFEQQPELTVEAQLCKLYQQVISLRKKPM
jgi:hypothetical protein